jgi:CheY-like chemotaxis protein
MPARELPELTVRRVLIVEDDDLVGETIAAMLEGDYQAVVAGTVDRALAHLGEPICSGSGYHKDPELILVDCLLPGGGLPQLLRAADQRSIPVVLISGDPESAARLDAGRPFLPKPFIQAQLLQMLRVTIG